MSLRIRMSIAQILCTPPNGEIFAEYCTMTESSRTSAEIGCTMTKRCFRALDEEDEEGLSTPTRLHSSRITMHCAALRKLTVRLLMTVRYFQNLPVKM